MGPHTVSEPARGPKISNRLPNPHTFAPNQKTSSMRLQCTILFFLSLGFVSGLSGQAKPQTLDLKKGQAFDIILLTNAEDNKEDMADYFNRASPIAKANGYAPSFGKAVGMPTLGNYHPDVVAFGTWPGISARVAAVEKLESGMSDFHEMRRKIWPTFNLTYYEVKEDVTITFDPEKYYVATMFWAEKKGKFNRFLKEWETAQLQQGGRPLLRLTEGASPFGYDYNPTYLTFTEWDSEEDFRAAVKTGHGTTYSGVKHLHQFPLL